MSICQTWHAYSDQTANLCTCQFWQTVTFIVTLLSYLVKLQQNGGRRASTRTSRSRDGLLTRAWISSSSTSASVNILNSVSQVSKPLKLQFEGLNVKYRSDFCDNQETNNHEIPTLIYWICSTTAFYKVLLDSYSNRWALETFIICSCFTTYRQEMEITVE